MDESRARQWFFILIVGVLALSVALAFPEIKMDWLALVAASAALRCGLLPAVVLTALVSWFFSAFSLIPPGLIFLPLGLALLAFQLIRSRLNAGFMGRGALLFLLLLFDSAFHYLNALFRVRQFYFSWEILLWPLATWTVGMYLLPVMGRFVGAIGRGFGARLRRPGSVSLSGNRRPFGFEKGF